MAIDHNFKVKKGLDVLGGDVNLGDGFAYKINGTTVVDSSRNLSNIGTISSGNITSSGNVTISGNLTVNGTQTILNTATLNVEDKNIVLNYGSGDTSASANGAGITIQDAVNSTTDATILWNSSVNRFDVSHNWLSNGNIESIGYLQHFGYLYSRDNLRVLNAAGTGWHDWATRSNGTFNLNVGTISSGAITTTTGAITVRYGSTPNISLTPTSTGGVINARNSSGTSVVVMDARGTPFLDVTGDLKTSGTVRIDSSGNATLGTIGSSGQHSITGGSAGSILLKIGSSTQTQYVDFQMASNSGVGELFKNGTAFTSYGGASSFNVYNSNGLIAFHPSNTANVLQIDTTGLNVGASRTIRMNSTTVIDSSRNLTNIGTISSGAITSSGSITATKLIDADNANAYVDPAGASVLEGSLLSKGHSSGDNWMPYTDGNFYIRAPNTFFDNNVKFQDGSGSLELTGDSSSNYYMAATGEIRIRPNGTTINKIVLNSTYINAPAYQVGGTTRINSVGDGLFTSLYIGSTNIVDTNRNLTNIGTISSGAITSSGDVKLNGDTKKYAAPVYRDTVTGISNSGYTTLFTVDGGGLASSIRLTLSGTTGSVVVNLTADISVGHYQDILITSRSGFYTTVTLKVTSNNNEDFAVEATTNHANSVSLACEVFPLNNELVTFTTSHSFTGQSHTHTCSYGVATSGNGGNSGDHRTRGRHFISDGSIASPSLVFENDHNTGIYRVGSDQIGWVSGGSRKFYTNTARAYFQNLSEGVDVPSLRISGTTVIDSSRNLTNIGTISSGAITSTGNVEGASLETNHTITFGYNSHYLQAGTGSLFFKSSSNASLGGIDASGFNTPYNYQIAGTTVIDSSRNLKNIVDITSSGHIKNGSYTRILTGASNTGQLTFNARWDGSGYVPDYAGVAAAGMTVLKMPAGGYGGLQVYVKKHGTTSSSQALSTFTKVAEFNDDGYFDASNGLRVADTDVINSSRQLGNIPAAAFGQAISAMDTTNLDVESAGHMSIRGGSYLYFGITSNNHNSWKNRITGFNTSTLHINAQGIQIDNTGYASPAVSWLTANNSTFSHKGNTIWHAGNDGSGSGLDADTLDGYQLSGSSSIATKIFNNKGQNHNTVTNFNTAMTPGPNYLQGYTNGPENTGQWYGFMFGLGNEYGTTTGSSGSYASQMYYKRNASNNANYLYMRSMENGSWQSWLKVSAGYADNSGLLDGIDSASFLRSDADDSTTGNITFSQPKGLIFANGQQIKDNGGGGLVISSSYQINLNQSTGLTTNGNTIWHAGNDGSGSGLDADNLDGVTWGSYKSTGHTNVNLQASNAYGIRFWNGNDQYKIFMSSQSGSGAGRQGYEPNSDYNMYFRMDGGTNRGFVFQDGAGNNKAGIDASGNIRADGVISSNNKQAMNCAHWSASGTSTGAIKITLPGTTSNYSMPVIEVSTYDYSSKAHVIYNISGHNWSTTSYWYNTRVTSEGGPPLTVRLGHDGTTHCIIIGETNTSWSYGSVTVALKVHPAHYASAQNFTTGWSASQITSLPSTVTAVTVGTIWHAVNDGSGSGLDADTLDGVQGASYLRSDADDTYSGNLTVNGMIFKSDSNTTRNFKIQGPSGNDVGITGFTSGGSHAFQLYGTSSSQYGFLDGNWASWDIRKTKNGAFEVDEGSGLQRVWNAGNDGSGSGLDADTLDGINSTSFARSDASTTYAFGNLQRFTSNTNIATASGTQSSLECFSNGSGNDAFMTFHVGGDYAIYFGLDGGTNKLSVGGWSMGAVSYEIYHSGNKPSLATLGYTGATNANYITNNNQLTNGAGYQTTSGNVRTLNTYQGSSDSNSLQYWQASGQNTDYAPSGDWYNTIRGGHGNPQTYYSNTLAMKMTGSGVGTIYTQTLSNGTFQGWNKYWHANNDGSGSGLDADLLDGMNASTSVANSSIVARDSNSYIYASHINFSTSESENPTINSFITSNGDGWSRKSTVDHVRAAVTSNNVYNNLRTSTGSGANLNTTFLNDRSGTFDCWSGSNFPPSTTHVQGLQVRHSTSTDYGWQLASQYNQPGKMYLRHVSNGTFYDWHTMWSSQNDGSGSGLDADLLDGYHSAENGASVNLRTGSNGYLYLDNWIRTGNSTGIYTNDGGYFYRAGAYWIQRGNSNNSVGTRYQTTDGTNRGYVYADNANQVGFLNNSANWVLKVQAAGSVYLGGTQQMRINSSSTTGILESTATNLVLRSSGGGVISLQNSSAAAIAEYTDAGNYSNVDGHTTLKRTANAPLIVDRLGTTGTSGTFNGEILNFRTAGTKRGEIGYKAFAYGDSPYFATYDWGLGFFSFSSSRYIQPCDGDGAIRDNQVDLGSTSARFDDVYATNGTIQTSDRNEKQDIQALTDAETRVATACKGLIRRYRWISSVEEKGDDARYHFGAIAQDVEAAFTAEGLDARNYGLFIRTTWWEHEGENYPAAEVAPTGAVEKTRLGIRYNQLLAFIISAL